MSACNDQTLKVFKGDVVVFDISFVEPREAGCDILDAKNITGYTIDISMPGTTADVTYSTTGPDGITITDAAKGQIQVTITAAKSLLLKRGDGQTFYAVLTDGSSNETTVKFPSALSVDERDFRS